MNDRPINGDVAEWLGRGLQNLVRRFESARHLCVCLLLLFSYGCRTPDPEPTLADSIHQITAEWPEATVGISLRDLDSGLAFDLNADRVFHAASTMKVPVMIEVFKRVDQGSLALSDSHVVTNEFRSIVDGSPYSMDIGEDSDDEVYGTIGDNATIEWLVDRMITVSSNLATNILIDLLNADSVQATIEQLGTTTMRVYRGVEDLKAYRQGLSNTATSADLATLLTRLARGEAVSESADQAMIAILAEQEFNDMIPAGLPEGTRVAHKTGSITKINHDAAIVFRDGKAPYVLVILTEGIEDDDESAKLGARLANQIHQSLVHN